MKSMTPEEKWESYRGGNSGIHLQWFAEEDPDPVAGATAPGTTAPEQAEPFFRLDDKTVFNTPEELRKAFSEGTMRHSEHRTAMDALKSDRLKYENDRASHLRERQEWEKNVEKYKQFDALLRSNPQAMRQMEAMLRQSPSGEDLQEVIKSYVEGTYGPKFQELEKAEKLRRAQEERDFHFAELQKEIPDLNREQIQKAFDELMKEGSTMRDMMRVLHFAEKGKAIKPEEIRATVVEGLEAKKAAKIPSSRGAAAPTGDDKSEKSMKALTNKLKAEVGG